MPYIQEGITQEEEEKAGQDRSEIGDGWGAT